MTQARWHQLTEWPMATAAVAFLSAYAWSVIQQPTGDPRALVDAIMGVTWVMFAIDYTVRFSLAERRIQWFVRHLHELVLVVVPMLRPLQFLRLITLIGVFQRTVGGALRGKVVAFAAGSTVLMILVSSLAMLDAERGKSGASITSFTDALWWAVATVTTVGYGDYAPVTDTGRLIALGLMIAGIALLGVVTATLASWLLQRVAEQDEASQSVTRAEVMALTEEVSALRAELVTARSARPDHEPRLAD
ncbi:potassium channel family protein [Rhodococcus marinonascens]|uniref:potassium channel family protein n=1 Tax=Rhodococcus marinonascens TaxID=38311 RepID=UPI000934FBC4|nr:potassium channel family protein [Rhodococcus marinonascens]